MPYFKIKMPIDCTDQQDAVGLQSDLEEFRGFTSKIVRGLITLYRTKPKLVRSLMNAAAGGNIKGALASIMTNF